MDRDGFDVGSRGRSSALQTCEKAAAPVLRSEAIAAARGHRLHSIGVTWSDDAGTEASLLLKSLTDSGFDNVVPVRLPVATEALARGIAEVIGYGTNAVCVLEPETVIALIVHTRNGAVQTAINHAIVTEEDLLRWLSAVFPRADWQPDALVGRGRFGRRRRDHADPRRRLVRAGVRSRRSPARPRARRGAGVRAERRRRVRRRR